MLDAAMAIVREEGADALSLVTLAAKAGVSRPVAYDHFSTRAGLLLALFQRLEDQYVQVLRNALGTSPHELGATADLMSKAYFNCLANLGPEAPAISAALKGSEEMAARQRAMLDEYIEIMCLALQPFSSLAEGDLRLTCVGLLGAAEAIAREQQDGRIAETNAIDVFSSLVAKSVGV
ncbi:TetR/AcrR family transcriptional regulator [Mesorhizobium sp. NPDC059054]|uniref:TetR/AcrR family transcriptional regulator n=1 Tax=Mesorhizobium sp. NPDC059054 TaxID=3346711 RepID=UPI0036A95067